MPDPGVSAVELVSEEPYAHETEQQRIQVEILRKQIERKEALAAEVARRRKSKAGVAKQDSYVSLAIGDHPPELKEQELKQLANVTFD
jgi:hypothetical protein